MNDIIVSFLAWFTWLKELLKILFCIFAFCLPISLFLLLVWQLFWFIKTFLSKIEDKEGVENTQNEEKTDLNLDNNENEKFKTKN